MSFEQATLFDLPPWWREHWREMPEFDQRDLTPSFRLEVNLASEAASERLAELVEQTITSETRSLWYPEADIGHYANKRYASEDAERARPRWPVYIVSKGRAFDDHRLTYRHLEEIGVPYYIVVEEQELDAYRRVVRRGEILVLDRSFQDAYDTFDDLGAQRSKGPGPARNFAWAHALAQGARYHWVMDDNINGFFRLNRNLKTPVADGAIFRAMEDFVERYENIAMAGPQYFMFLSRKSAYPALVANTRIYSCNLIRNDIAFRWRGRYNEDTDLSLRILKSGAATVQFNAFLQYKAPTQSIKGGNTAEFYHAEGQRAKGAKYAANGTLAKSEMIVAMHPDVARLAWRFERVHHYVDYAPFKRNSLRLRAGVELADVVDDYGMRLYEWPTIEEALAWVAERARRRESK